MNKLIHQLSLCLMAISMVMANPIQPNSTLSLFSVVVSQSCVDSVKSAEMKKCLGGSDINRSQMLGTIAALKRQCVVPDADIVDRTAMVECCAVNDINSCLNTIAKDDCTSHERDEILEQVAMQVLKIENGYYQDPLNGPQQCSKFSSKCWTDIPSASQFKQAVYDGRCPEGYPEKTDIDDPTDGPSGPTDPNVGKGGSATTSASIMLFTIVMFISMLRI